MRSFTNSLLGSRWLWIVTRVLLSVVFLTSGLAMLLDFGASAQGVRQLGLTPPALWNVLVIVTLIGGSILILLDRYMWLAAVTLGGFLGLTILLVHHFWSLPQPRAMAAMHIALEHMSLVGGLSAAAIASFLRSTAKRDHGTERAGES